MSILDGVKAYYFGRDGRRSQRDRRTIYTLYAYDRRVLVRKQKRSRSRGGITVHNYCTTTAIRNER